MSRQTLLFACVSAMLVPIGGLLVLALNPYATFKEGIRAVVERGHERPMQWLVIATWMIILGLMGAGLSLVRTSLQRRSRQRQGLCLSCGYDLRGTPSGRCPECGTIPPAAKGSAA
jgi:hypothetical protein